MESDYKRLISLKELDDIHGEFSKLRKTMAGGNFGTEQSFANPLLEMNKLLMEMYLKTGLAKV